MPTVGWIQETAVDRYWERGGLGDQYPPTPMIHYCAYCTRQFESTKELSTHISVDHPVERPVIFIGNRAALSEQTIRTPLSKNDLVEKYKNRLPPLWSPTRRQHYEKMYYVPCSLCQRTWHQIQLAGSEKCPCGIGSVKECDAKKRRARISEWQSLLKSEESTINDSDFSVVKGADCKGIQ